MNYHALPVAQPVQRYTIDYETVGRQSDPWPAMDELISRVSDPRWSRERACWGCNNWKPVDVYAHLPFRPGVGRAAVDTCTSCHYAKLDQVSIDPDMAEDTLLAMAALREGWHAVKASLSGKAYKPKGKRPRTLTLENTSMDEGYKGKRWERPVERQPAFSYKPNNPSERIDCPWCGEKNGAQVERYTRIRPKEADVRFVAIACLVGTCGKRIAQPEVQPWPTYKQGEQPIAPPK